MDSDTIACEACGSRLLFSTPASWTQQQGKPFFSPLIFGIFVFNQGGSLVVLSRKTPELIQTVQCMIFYLVVLCS